MHQGFKVGDSVVVVEVDEEHESFVPSLYRYFNSIQEVVEVQGGMVRLESDWWWPSHCLQHSKSLQDSIISEEA